MLDANKELGGNTVICGGIVLDSGGGTPVQIHNGITDSPEEFFERLSDPTIRDRRKSDPALLRAYCNEFPICAKWLEDHGVTYSKKGTEAEFPLGDWYELDMGGINNNHVIMCELFMYNQPTKWNPMPEPGFWYNGGVGLVYPLRDYLEEKGTEILLEHKVTSLIREPESPKSVLGVQVETGGNTLYFKAKKGVILATGSWKGAQFLRTLYDPRMTPDLIGSGEPWVYCDGSGILTGLETGAAMTAHEQYWHLWHRHFGTLYHSFPAGSPIAEPGINISGNLLADVIFVNSSGERFVNEAASEKDEPEGSFYDYALPQKDHILWAIFDDAAAQKNHWDLTPKEELPRTVDPELVFAADTVEELADMIGVPADALGQTVSNYNSYVESGVDPDFGKPNELLTAKIETPPFHAVWISLQIHDTMSGLLINDKGQVIDIYGQVIPHLYAHGEVAGGIDVGLGMSHGIVFGKIAGENAAAETAWE